MKRLLFLLLILPCLAFQELKTITPDRDDQLVLFKLKAKISTAQLTMADAQIRFDQAKKELDESVPIYNHEVELAKKKLPPPEKGKIWTTRESKETAIEFYQIEAPKEATASDGKKP